MAVRTPRSKRVQAFRPPELRKPPSAEEFAHKMWQFVLRTERYRRVRFGKTISIMAEMLVRMATTQGIVDTFVPESLSDQQAEWIDRMDTWNNFETDMEWVGQRVNDAYWQDANRVLMVFFGRIRTYTVVDQAATPAQVKQRFDDWVRGLFEAEDWVGVLLVASSAPFQRFDFAVLIENGERIMHEITKVFMSAMRGRLDQEVTSLYNDFFWLLDNLEPRFSEEFGVQGEDYDLDNVFTAWALGLRRDQVRTLQKYTLRQAVRLRGVMEQDPEHRKDLAGVPPMFNKLMNRWRLNMDRENRFGQGFMQARVGTEVYVNDDQSNPLLSMVAERESVGLWDAIRHGKYGFFYSKMANLDLLTVCRFLFSRIPTVGLRVGMAGEVVAPPLKWVEPPRLQSFKASMHLARKRGVELPVVQNEALRTFRQERQAFDRKLDKVSDRETIKTVTDQWNFFYAQLGWEYDSPQFGRENHFVYSNSAWWWSMAQRSRVEVVDPLLESIGHLLHDAEMNKPWAVELVNTPKAVFDPLAKRFVVPRSRFFFIAKDEQLLLREIESNARRILVLHTKLRVAPDKDEKLMQSEIDQLENQWDSNEKAINRFMRQHVANPGRMSNADAEEKLGALKIKGGIIGRQMWPLRLMLGRVLDQDEKEDILVELSQLYKDQRMLQHIVRLEFSKLLRGKEEAIGAAIVHKELKLEPAAPTHMQEQLVKAERTERDSWTIRAMHRRRGRK